jgi:transcriptional regulator with XRE-family HTH domain
MKMVESISRSLRDARLRAHLTQRQLAARAETTQALVARVERGQANPTVDTLQRLFAAAGFDVDFVVHPRTGSDQVIESYKRDVDRTLVRENLRKDPADRVATLAAMARFHDEARRARGSKRPRRT